MSVIDRFLVPNEQDNRFLIRFCPPGADGAYQLFDYAKSYKDAVEKLKLASESCPVGSIIECYGFVAFGGVTESGVAEIATCYGVVRHDFKVKDPS